MAVTHTLRTQGANSGNQTSYQTASISFNPNRLALLAISARNVAVAPPPNPTVAGCGLNWQHQPGSGAAFGVSGQDVIWFYRAITGKSPGSGPLTISFGATTLDYCVWIVLEVAGVPLSDSFGTSAFRQTVANGGLSSSGGVTLGSAVASGNRVYAIFAHEGNEVNTVKSGWSQVGSTGSSGAPDSDLVLMTNAAGDNNPQLGWSNTRYWGGNAVELIAATDKSVIDAAVESESRTVSVSLAGVDTSALSEGRSLAADLGATDDVAATDASSPPDGLIGVSEVLSVAEGVGITTGFDLADSATLTEVSDIVAGDVISEVSDGGALTEDAPTVSATVPPEQAATLSDVSDLVADVSTEDRDASY